MRGSLRERERKEAGCESKCVKGGPFFWWDLSYVECKTVGGGVTVCSFCCLLLGVWWEFLVGEMIQTGKKTVK